MHKEFEELAHRWTPYELFYKDLYEKKQQGDDVYKKYLKTLDPKVLQEKWVSIPDLYEPVSVFSESIPSFTMEGSVAVCKHARYTPASVHTHNYFEIVCVMEGSVSHKIEDNPVQELTAGDIFILPDHVYHTIETMDDDTIVINILFRKSKFQETFLDVFMGNNFLSEFFWNIMHGANGEEGGSWLFFQTGQNPDIRQCIERMYVEYVKKQNCYERIIICELQCMFAYLIRGYEQYYKMNDQNRLKLKILQYIRANYNNCTLESVARHFNYSTAYLSRLIRQMTGESFSGLLRNYRLNMAQRMLEETNLQMIQISEEIGYKNISHFNNIFREKYHMTPGEYRKAKQ